MKDKVIAKCKEYVVVLTVLALITSLIGLLNEYHDVFDLFNHFRVQYITVAAIFLGTGFYLKQKKTISLSIFIILFNIACIIYYALPFLPTPLTQQNCKTSYFSLLVSNVKNGNKNFSAFLDMIKKEKPDTFTVIELSHSWAEQLKILDKDYSYKFEIPMSVYNFGMGIYSKKPFTAKDIGTVAHNRQTKTYPNFPMVLADFKDHKILVVHPAPPAPNLSSSVILPRYIEEIGHFLEKDAAPVVIAGDLNATLWSKYLTKLNHYSLQNTNRQIIGYTWHTRFFPFAVQIDHILTRGFFSKGFRILGHVGSDHFPLKADLCIK